MSNNGAGGHCAKHFTHIINTLSKMQLIPEVRDPRDGAQDCHLPTPSGSMWVGQGGPAGAAHLLDGVLLAGHLGHLADALDVVLQVHLEAAGEGQVGLGPDINVDLVGQHVPVPVPHARVAQPLDQRPSI